MELFTGIMDAFLLMYNNSRIVFPFLISALIFVLVYAYHVLKPVRVPEVHEIAAHWEACDSIYRMIDYLSDIAKKRKAAEIRQRPQIIPSAMRVSQPRDQICYPDLINPFKYVTPRIRTASLIQLL